MLTKDGFCWCGESNKHDDKLGLATDFEYETTHLEFGYRRCNSCSSIYIDPIPKEEEIQYLYPSNYEPYRFHELPKLVLFVRNRVQRRKFVPYVKDGDRVLDIGCGNGNLCLDIKSEYKQSLVMGIDFHIDQRLTNQNGVEFREISISGTTNLGLEFDRVFSLQVIEHFANPKMVVQMAWNHLEIGGTFVIETPNWMSIDFRLFGKRFWGGYHCPRHLTIFASKSIKRLLEEEGFQVNEIRYLMSPAFWIQSMHHFVSKRSRVVASFFVIKNPIALFLACLVDGILLVLRKRTSNMRIVASKRLKSNA